MDGEDRSGRGTLRAVAICVALLIVTVPRPATAAQPSPTPAAEGVVVLPAAPRSPIRLEDANVPAGSLRWSDPEAQLSFAPPPGWVRTAATSLNPQADPPEPVLELVRFQVRAGDPTLYATPVPVTSALVRDAGAIISIAIARGGTDLAVLRLDERRDDPGTARLIGFIGADEEAEYEGSHLLTRTLVARSGTRVIVVRAYAEEERWAALRPVLRASIASLRADPDGPIAPAAAPPPPAPIEQTPAAAVPSPAIPAAVERPPVAVATLAVRQEILARARQLLGTPYVWGGNVAGRAMDCSAYVSAAWNLDRYSTDTIGRVSSFIQKKDLRPGHAVNLTIGRDPQRRGHIRLYEAWANEAHSLLWVYEETPPRAVHRVIAYDDRYQPIRLDGLSSAGATAVIAAPLSVPERPSTPARQVRPAEQPVPRSAAPTARPAVASTPRPSLSLDTVYELRSGVLVPVARPTPKPRATARPTVQQTRPTARPDPRPSNPPTLRPPPPRP